MPTTLSAWKSVLNGLRRGTSRVRKAVIVLAYHDLCEQGDIDSWMRIEVSRFREHLRLLAGCGSLLPPADLDHIAELPDSGPHFLLTFDDGTANWLRLAVPVLREFEAHGLFFVSTHHAVTGEPFWFDRIVWGLQSSDAREVDLRSFGLRIYRFREARGARRWDDIQTLMADIKRLGNPEDHAVDAVIRHVESLGDAARTDAHLRPLTTDELRQMAGVPYCHFGSHGHRHQILTRLTGPALSDELAQSRGILQQLTAQAVTEVAYPNGDCDGRIVQACRDTGYERGFTVRPAVLSATAERYLIPRLLVGAYDSTATLAARITKVIVRHLVGGVRRETRLLPPHAESTFK